MANPQINRALGQWPADRFPPKFQDYWAWRFRAYSPEDVADAIDAVRMDTDPYKPTCEAVESKLREMGVIATEQPAPQIDYEKVRRIGAEHDARHAADNSVCNTIGEAKFAEVAELVIRNLEPEVAALLRRKPLNKSQLIRSMVADHARQHGIVRSRIMEVA